MRIKINRATCIGCGTCTAIAPKSFILDNQMKAVVKKKDGSQTSGPVDASEIDDTRENILNAVNSCPAGAILIEE